MSAVMKQVEQTPAMSEAALVEVLSGSLYPGAAHNSVVMVLAYCQAAHLDPMLKPVHIVPVYQKGRGMVDVVMPGIGLYRIQAARTGQYAGISDPEFGPSITTKLAGVEVTYPEWCRVTVKRQMSNGLVAEFTASERWLENYATAGKDSAAPNAMWKRRAFGGYSLDDIPITAPALRAQAQCSHRADSEVFIVAGTLQANGKAAGSATQQDAESGLLVVHGTQDPGVSSSTAFALGRNNGQENAVLAFSCKDHGAHAGAIAPTLRAMNHSGSHANAGGQVAVCITGDITHTLKADGFDGSEDGTGRGQPIVAFTQISRSEVRNIGGDGQIVGALAAETGAQQQNYLANASMVRRLTPCECERLQGMPDDYTLIPWRGKPAGECPDGPRYKAIGNSKAVTVVRWIGRRILKQITPSPYG